MLLVEFPGSSDDEANRAAIALGRSLAGSAARGFRDAIPAARTLLVLFDPDELARERIAGEITRDGAASPAEDAPPRLVRLPVVYGGEAARDLAELARAAGLPEDELVRRHAAAEYRVAFLGFAPGFAYLTGLPRELHASRLSSPRPRVPAGAVGIGGAYTGVYPAAMPGGWRLIGRSPAALFDPGADRPALLSPGDRVRFAPIRDEGPPPPAPRDPRQREGRAVLRVVSPGLFATVQGAARYGRGSSGVPAGGAMDTLSLRRANALAGNAADAPALEIALLGPELEALEDVVVAIAGADIDAVLDGRPAPREGAFHIAAGSRLRLSRTRCGARAYLALRGGFAEPRRPGETPRRVEAGEELVARPVTPMEPSVRVPDGLVPSNEIDLRVMSGPHRDHFTAAARERFLSTPWRVSSVSDRRGLRLEGDRLEHALAPDVPPEGAVFGSVQVPGEGFPIVLGPDGPVTGGYPKIATVVESDLPRLGQAAPGDVLRFRAVTLEEAIRARREYD